MTEFAQLLALIKQLHYSTTSKVKIKNPLMISHKLLEAGCCCSLQKYMSNIVEAGDHFTQLLNTYLRSHVIIRDNLSPNEKK